MFTYHKKNQFPSEKVVKYIFKFCTWFLTVVIQFPKTIKTALQTKIKPRLIFEKSIMVF